MTNDREYMRSYMREYNRKHRKELNEYYKERAKRLVRESVAFEGLMAWLEQNGYEEAVRKGKELCE